MDILSLELRKLGLKAKEISIYLAALELGHTSVQKIAEKAGLSRPTSHQTIKTLEKKGLMAKSKEKGKTYYSAESPDKLLGILRLEKRVLEEREREFTRIISALKAKYYLSEKSEIRTYHGQNGLKVLADDFSQTRAKEIFVLDSGSVFLTLFRARYEAIKKRLGGQVEIKEKISEKIPGTLVLYDKIIYFPEPKKAEGLLIENRPLLELLKALFLALWEKN